MSLAHDPQENDPAFKFRLEQAMKEAEDSLAAVPRRRGYCHRLWAETKRILREKYGLDWKTPSEMNPGVLFD